MPTATAAARDLTEALQRLPTFARALRETRPGSRHSDRLLAGVMTVDLVARICAQRHPRTASMRRCADARHAIGRVKPKASRASLDAILLRVVGGVTGRRDLLQALVGAI